MKKGFLIFIFIVLLCNIAFVAAEDNNTVISSDFQDTLAGSDDVVHGSVSGDVVVASNNPWSTTGELNYKIPSDAKNIKSAEVYVNVYSGSGSNKYGADCNVSLTTYKGTTQLGSEVLCYDFVENTMYDPEVYVVSDHVTKSVSDYQITYDVTDIFKDLKSSSFVTIHVNTFKHQSKQFDGRIKSIALLLAYDDGDDDVINYWIDSTQRWTQDSITETFNTDFITNDNFLDANLVNIALSSNKGQYKINDNFLGEINHMSGNYYQYDSWDVSNYINFGFNTSFYSKAAVSSIYSKESLKNVLTVLKIKNGSLKVKTTFDTEYPNTCFAGTNNILTVNVNTNKPGEYIVNLYVNGTFANSTSSKLISGNNKMYLNDKIIRSIDESTVSGNINNYVNYTVEVLFNNSIVDSSQILVPVLYNGYLSKDFAYPNELFQPFFNQTFTGEFIIDTKGTSLSSSDMSKTDVWNVSLDDSSIIINGLVYIPYNWFNGEECVEDVSMFNVTFNNVEIAPISFTRDQCNIGGYAKFGYGILIYNVTNLIRNGKNTLILNKKYSTPAVYPSSLIYVTNSTLSKFTKKIYAINGADVLFNDYNLAKRIIKIDSNIKVNVSDVANAELYVLAASAERNDGNVIFNNKTFSNVWRGTSVSTSLFKTDISDLIKENNNMSFVATGSTIMALPFFVVTSNNITDVAIESTEYKNICYAGTNNTLTVVVNTNNANYYSIKLYADSNLVNTTIVYLSGTNKVFITDPIIRDIDVNTVHGKNNAKVNYTVELLLGDEVISTSQLQCSVLYNGYLNKTHAFNASDFESFYTTDFTGDLIISTKDSSSYLSEFDPRREDTWNINLNGNSNIVKSFVFIPFSNFNPNFSFTDINTVFNGVEIFPCEINIDQPNLANNHLLGVLIYDVTNLIKKGDNTLSLTKNCPTPAIYPSSLVYMCNTTGSNVIKTISMITGVDLLSNDYNGAGRLVQTNNMINISSKNLANAEIYIMAAGAQENEGNIVFNGKIFENVWKGSEKTTDLFKSSVLDVIKDSNSISFVATGGNILALQQFVVVTKNIKENTPVKPADSTTPTIIKKNCKIVVSKKTFKAKIKVKKYTITLKSGKNPIKKVVVTLKVKGKTYKAKTNSKGKAVFKIKNLKKKGKYTATIKFKGNKNYKAATKKVKITVKK